MPGEDSEGPHHAAHRKITAQREKGRQKGIAGKQHPDQPGALRQGAAHVELRQDPTDHSSLVAEWALEVAMLYVRLAAEARRIDGPFQEEARHLVGGPALGHLDHVSGRGGQGGAQAVDHSSNLVEEDGSQAQAERSSSMDRPGRDKGAHPQASSCRRAGIIIFSPNAEESAGDADRQP